MTTLDIPTPPDVKYIHVITTTHVDRWNVPSPESLVRRISFRRDKAGRFVRFHAAEHDQTEIYRGIQS